MKKLIVFSFVLLITATAFAEDGWKWKPLGSGKAITPAGDRTAVATSVNAYDATAAETLPEVALKGATVYNGGATGTEEYSIPDIEYETKFYVEARVAQTIELDWVESGANPYLEGVQVGADNEIDVPAGARLMIERQYRAGAWVWWCTILAGAPADGGADN